MDFKLKILIDLYEELYPALIHNEMLLSALKKLDPTTVVNIQTSGGQGTILTVAGITADQKSKDVKISIDILKAKIAHILDEIDHCNWNTEFEEAKTKMHQTYGQKK